MEKIQNQKHTKETLYYFISRMLERASFYGFRSLVVIYMIGESLKMERVEALNIYGWFTGSIVFSQIVGALFGDLIIGNRKSIIIGGILQAIGAFSISSTSTTGLYIGLLLVSLGSGFFTPNIISNFGKTYLNKLKLLDSGFTIFYLAAELGSIVGILIIGYLGEMYGYNIGFALSGILILIPILLTKEKKLDEIERADLTIKTRVLIILFTFIFVGLFWGFYEISNIRSFDIQLALSEMSTLFLPNHIWQSINSIPVLLLSPIAIILWTFYYSNQLVKLMLGFVFGAISFGMLFLIPEVPTEQHTTIYIISLLFLGISEIHIAPIVHSILTKYSNPKYLAILVSLAVFPTRLIFLFFAFVSLNEKLYDNPMLGLKIGVFGMAIIGIGLIGYIKINKKPPTILNTK